MSGRHALIAALAAALLLPQSGWGQAPRGGSDESELLLSSNPVVVTASKTPERLSEAPAAVTVITEEDIRRSGMTTVPDLLRTVPGVDVIEPNHSEADVSIRGFNKPFSDQLLVMIDGRSIYQDFYGGVRWNQEPLLISQIKQIEVVRGPGSALYGANAFGGVINIITKTPSELMKGAQAATLRAELSDRHDTFAEASAGSASRGFSWIVGGSERVWNGESDDRPGHSPDHTRAQSLILDGEQALSGGGLRVSLGGLKTRGDLTTPYTAYRDGTVSNSHAVVSYQTSGAAPVSVRVFQNSYVERYDTGTVANQIYDLEAQQTRTLSERHHLVYGGNYRAVWEKGTLTGPMAHTQRLSSLYIQDDARLAPDTHLFMGVRADFHSLYGNQISPRISLVQRLRDRQTLRVSYATAFRAPTLLDSYYDLTQPLFAGLSQHYIGNPDLRPEQIKSIEIGYRKDDWRGNYEISLYHNRMNGLLTYVATRYSGGYTPGIPLDFTEINGPSATAEGIELSGEYRPLPRLRLIGQYSYCRAMSEGKPVDLSPRNMASLTVQGDLGDRCRAALTGNFVGGAAFTLREKTLPVDSYTRLDAHLGYRLGGLDHPFVLSLTATNLLNDGHRELPDARTDRGVPISNPQPRTLWASLETKW